MQIIYSHMEIIVYYLHTRCKQGLFANNLSFGVVWVRLSAS